MWQPTPPYTCTVCGKPRLDNDGKPARTHTIVHQFCSDHCEKRYWRNSAPIRRRRSESC